MPNVATKKSKLENEDEDGILYISVPRQTDVLCGRGGMSNHHPGNEWYRRLVKSNRPLYRACPKHTKLLVAKAIVQAVEQQQGRFLEKSPSKHGCWHPVSYKRAVDKTSQGLREKDRSGDNGDSEKANALFPTVTPQMDTTALARQMSTREPFQQPTTTTTAHGAGTMQQPQQVPMVHGKPASLLPTASVMAQGAAVSWNTTTWHDDNGDDDDATESEGLPEPLEEAPRDTSMYRLLKHTSLLPGTSMDDPPMEQQQSLLQQRHAMQQHVKLQMQLANRARRQQQVHPHQPGFVQQQQRLQEFPTRSALYLNSTSRTSKLSQQLPQRPGTESVEAAPSFTRFQSQVSDWLNSFWPLQEGEAPVTTTARSNVGARPPVSPAATAAAAPSYQQSPSRKRKARYPPPTEPTEEETTSQTLLQYATSSKLFRGLTGLFTTTDDTASAAGPSSVDGGGKPSLLDDYEETPMEARMRQLE